MANESILGFGDAFCHEFAILMDRSESDILVWISAETDVSVLSYVVTRLGRQPVIRRVSVEELREKLTGSTLGSASSSSMNGTPVATGPPGLSDSRIVEGINDLVTSCIAARASDIHFEPHESRMICRARIDGVLVEKKVIEKAEVAETISRLKIMAGLDIAEKRRPQDGRIRFRFQDRLIDIRVSVIPTDFGEKAVLRILDKKSLRLDIDSLGFTESQLAQFRDGIHHPHGIILVTGPTGSGKTTTLYAALTHLRSPHLNISTVEDPIEYNLEGINQTQVKPEIGLTFSSMLRALLRQDPNILMVGEIRDRETLDIAIRASLTGHLVLSTIHTNSAVATLTRLADMGAERSLLATTIRLIVAQRLVRKNCPNCIDKTLDDNNRAAARRMNIELGPNVRKSRGCESCNHTGFLGRIAVYEVLSVDESVKKVITDGRFESDILKFVSSRGFQTMQQIAQSLINTGVTTPSEVLREINA